MEDLITKQLAQKELMESFVKNYKKAGKERRTQVFYKKQIETLQSYWEEFRSVHKSVLALKYKDTTFKPENYRYFKAEIYAETEDFFLSNLEAIEERYIKEFPPAHPKESSGKKSDDGVEFKETFKTTAIKLPKLSLDKFDGDYRMWPTFYDLFKTLVHENKTLAAVQKLQYLKLHLTGEPEQLLRHFQVTEKNYSIAWEMLKERYENKRVLVNNELKILFNQNLVSHETASGIKRVLDTTSECLQALSNLDMNIEGWDPIIVFITIQKLPKDTHQLWEQEVSKSKDLPTWKSLKEFLEARFRTLEAISSNGSSGNREQRVNNTKTRTPQSFVVATKSACPVCHEDHSIRQCPKLSSLNSVHRWQVVKAHGLCLNCLGSGHLSSNCPSQKKCYYCNQNHHSLLHRNTNETFTNTDRTRNFTTNTINSSTNRNTKSCTNPTENNAEQKSTLSATAPVFFSSPEPSTSQLNSYVVSQAPKTQVLLATALVRVISTEGEEQIVRALIDQGSQASFLTESVVQNLKLKKQSIHANVQGLGQNHAGQVNARVTFQIKPLKGEEAIYVSGLILKNLTSLLPSKQIMQENWRHIQGLELADPEFFNPGRVDLLLGADVYSHIIMNGLMKGPCGTPIAQKTKLGWILSGQINSRKSESLRVTNFHVCTDLNNQLKKFWELEEIKNSGVYTEEERACEEIFTKTTKRLPNGRYQVELPLKCDGKCIIGKSRNIALSRLNQQEKIFSKNPILKAEYDKCLEEYISLGHMEKIKTGEEIHSQQSNGESIYSHCYLPHHGVIKETSSTTKLRVVFDASRPTQSGYSLNDMMLKGPVIQDDLTAILIRWRKHVVALTADLEKMYRQIRVKDEHAELQRIVWRQPTTMDIQDFKLLTVTFGTKSAPYLATRVLQQLANDEISTYPKASNVTLSDFYVDDLLSGANSIQLALEMQAELINLMKAGGFSLRKWSSNCQQILENLPEECKVVSQIKNLSDSENIRTLGTHWNPQTDMFSFSLDLGAPPSKWTKRNILSEVAKLFDPLGWLTPCIIIAKVIIQKLWLAGTNWDEEVHEETKAEWIKYREKIKDCEKLRIPRWIQCVENQSRIEIHGFCDASNKAYAAAVYIRSTQPDGKTYVNLVSSKSKVAPIKTVSLPRLELCGAVLLAKLICYVIKALRLASHPPVFAWTDSEIVLAWLRAHPSKWKTFVANRVSHIHELLGENIWNHIASKDNPADCASRGMYPDELGNFDLWWHGPTWLKEEKAYWPQHKDLKYPEIEQRKLVNYHVNIESDQLEMKISSFTKLSRVIAYCKRFIENCRKPKPNRETEFLKAFEIKTALNILIKRAQKRHFCNEIDRLTSNNIIDRKSRLLNLNPFIDSEGFLRVGGRLRYSDLSYDEKFPIILTDKDPLTKLLIEKVHRDTLHGGPQLMLSIIGRKYWILNARNTIRHHIHKCLACFKQKAQTQQQLMGDLPVIRMKVNRPFTHTGIDYCGPFDLKNQNGRNAKKYKGYIALFVCMSTKALHLELVTDLSAQGFIAAFRRFTSRRGLCSEVYSDCGTNFIGAHKILAKEHRQMIDGLNLEVAEILENEGIKFNFIPPASPHFGGLWEAGVRSTKYHLKRVLGNTILTYEDFATILTQIEACLNSRPLCEMSSNPNDMNPLTPAHLLIGSVLLTPPEPNLDDLKINRLDRWQYLQRLLQSFWKRWNAEYLCRLQQRPKWNRKCENLQVGDLVILKDENLPPCRWILGRIKETHPGKDGLVRVVTLQTKNNILKRPITKLCRLPLDQENEN